MAEGFPQDHPALVADHDHGTGGFPRGDGSRDGRADRGERLGQEGGSGRLKDAAGRR